MTCSELTNDVLLDFSEWRLAPAERYQVARHLVLCRHCQGRRDEIEAMTEAIRHAPESPPSLLLDELDRTVPDWPRPARILPKTALIFGIVAAAGVLLIVVVAATLLRRSRPSAPPSQVSERPKGSLESPPQASRGARATAPVPSPAPPAPTPRTGPEAAAVRPPAETPPRAPAATGPRLLLGDLNGDGVVDIADARILLRLLTLGLPLPPNADVNGDGVVDIADVRMIVRSQVKPR
jgi:hypothetical protein